MNNTNIILEAIGELDNEILERAFKSKKKKPITLAIITAAAMMIAAVTLLGGFTTPRKNNVSVNGKKVFEYRIRIHDEIAAPPYEFFEKHGFSERFLKHYDKLFGDGAGISYEMKDINPRELIKAYNANTLDSEYFSTVDFYDLIDPPHSIYTRIHLGFAPGVSVNNNFKYTHKDGTVDYSSYVSFCYWMRDDSLELPVCFMVSCVTGNYSNSFARNFETERQDGSDIEIIDLNNGEQALLKQTDYSDGVMKTCATFSYDGFVYTLYSVTDIDNMKQVLSDLGITG